MSELDRSIVRLASFGFHQLYTRLAWSYDLVAASVSFGEWQAWGRCAIPFIRGRRVLELAHGPGHLHLTLRRQGYTTAGIDLSPQMGVLAGLHLRRAGLESTLARADATRLPFPDGEFESVVSTFPTGFIFAPDTLASVWRVLKPGGALIVVPNAILRGAGIAPELVRSLYRLTGQREIDPSPIERVLRRAGFSLTQHAIPTRRAEVTVWVCERCQPAVSQMTCSSDCARIQPS